MEHYQYHWAFIAANNVVRERGEKEKYVCAAGITPSGTVHIGNFREIITVELVVRALKKIGKQARYLYSWDDFDVFRRIPANMPEQERLQEYLRRPITNVPDTFDCRHESFALHNEAKVEEILPRVGVAPEFIKQSLKYGNCDYAEEINHCLKHREQIRPILNKYRKEDLPGDWLPVSIFCDKCGKDTIKEIAYLEDYTVRYACECGHEETFDIREKGIIKLNWRVDWPMRWHYEQADFEPAGKDHFASGGSRDVAVEIIKTLWKDTPPHGFMYEWIAIKGGGEFSSSKGIVTTLQDVLDIYEPELVRWLFAGTRPNATFNISFDTDVIKIYEDFDKCERIYFGQEEANEKEKLKQRVIYELSSIEDQPPERMPVQPSFRHITTILQTYEHDVERTISFFSKDATTDVDKKRVMTRVTCAKNWLEKHAPDDFKFRVLKSFNLDYYDSLDQQGKDAVGKTYRVINEFQGADQEALAAHLYQVPKEMDMDVKEYFAVIYNMVIGKEKGPKLAPFLLDIGFDRVKKLLVA